MRLVARLRGTLALLRRLPLVALVVLGVLAAGGIGLGVRYAYRTYEFVEHDNSFCLQCHLMVDPYERFARSAHRDLGCKECHRPTLAERSRMALTQIIENPDQLGVHAEVPNEVCADCHVYGDPERWSIVASSAGHRVHLESDDPALEGLQCVECHSTSVHEFAATDRTCAQAGCHEDAEIRLGAMSDLMIHCAACHGFGASVDEAVAPATEPVDGAAPRRDAVREALAPDEETCLGCHAMRLLVDLPEPDPHGGVCADCHDPHTQETPERAVESCAAAGCHEEPETLTPFHVGLDAGVLERCSSCHSAHDFALDGSDCLACHAELFGGRGAMSGPPVARFALLDLAHGAPAEQVPEFSHERHRELACASCHSSEERHGAVTVTTTEDCRGCHHTEPVAGDCTACHEASVGPEAGPRGGGVAASPDVFEAPRGGAHRVVRTLALSTGSVRRDLPFDHAVHAGEACASCHTEGLERSAADVDCASCHAEHHDPDRACMVCHADAPDQAHPVTRAHVTCSGAGCHTDVPFDEPPRTRSACLVCHQDLVDHRPGGDCAACHVLPGPPPAGEASR